MNTLSMEDPSNFVLKTRSGCS